MSQRLRASALLITLVAAGVIALVAARPEAVGQQKDAPAAGANPAETAIRNANAAYVEAMTKGDLDGIMALWADDADYIDEAGKMIRGKDQIAAIFKKSLPEIKGSKIAGRIHSMKFVRPEICLEDGVIEVTSPTGTKEASRYAVVWTKTGEKWLISSVRDLPAEVTDLPSIASAQLKDLEWLVGEWADDGGKGEQTAKIYWAPNKSFLIMDYTVKLPDRDPLEVVVRVGWDGAAGRVRSWVFDTQGGFAEGLWQKDGTKRWLIGQSGVLPDGGTGGSTNSYEFIDANTFVWRAVDRDVDNQPLPDVQIKYVRKTAK
jgi:uncharacterized protein (TIGR02246 family)